MTHSAVLLDTTSLTTSIMTSYKIYSEKLAGGRNRAITNKREGMIVQFDHSRISQLSPSLMPGISGLGTRDTNVPIPQPQLASAEPKMANVIKAMRRAGEE